MPQSKQIQSIVKNISSVDMATIAAESSSSNASKCDAIRSQPTAPQSPCPEDLNDGGDQVIDGHPFFYTADSIGAKVRDFIDRLNSDEQIAVDPLPLRDEDHFRAWALRERARFQGTASDQGDAAEQATTESYMTGAGGATRKKGRRFNAKNVIRHITGYMYGPFTRPPSPDGVMQKENKFGIPTTMTDRAKRCEKTQTIQEDELRRARMDSLGFKQPPDKDDSSDDEDASVLNVKKLALVRTPYFTVPTIRIDKVKRAKQFRNRFLSKDRLKRINLLLRDDKDPNQQRRKSQQQVEQQRLVTERRKQSVAAKFMQLLARKKTRPDDRDRDPEKEKYYELIQKKFVESRTKCEPEELVSILFSLTIDLV